MNLTEVKNKIQTTDWYNQGAAVSYFFISYPWTTCTLMKIRGRKINHGYAPLFVYFHPNGFMDNNMDKAILKKVAEYYINQQKSDDRFIQKLYSDWNQSYVNKFLKMSELVIKTDLTKLSGSKLLKLFDLYGRVYIAVWYEAIFLDSFDYYSDIALEHLLDSEEAVFKGDNLEILLTPSRASFLLQERLEILKLAEKIVRTRKGKGAKNLSFQQALREHKFLEISLMDLSKKFYWIANDFINVEYLGPEHFYNKTMELVEEKVKLRQEREMKNFINKLGLKKNAIRKKYKLSKNFINLAAFFSELGSFRDLRKTCNQIANSSLNCFVDEFASRYGIKKTVIHRVTWWELREWIIKDAKKLAHIAESRSGGELAILTGATPFISLKGRVGRELHSLLQQQMLAGNKLQGKPAYGGVVRGLVRIVKDRNDFNKMKKGDILVAPNTRPEYVPIMKIAGAIVTDEGGITSHAAIVSRELKVPCVVGVQGATKILIDGDMIEVDAKNGLIIIVNN